MLAEVVYRTHKLYNNGMEQCVYWMEIEQDSSLTPENEK